VVIWLVTGIGWVVDRLPMKVGGSGSGHRGTARALQEPAAPRRRERSTGALFDILELYAAGDEKRRR
jgi:hypothetical protein